MIVSVVTACTTAHTKTTTSTPKSSTRPRLAQSAALPNNHRPTL